MVSTPPVLMDVDHGFRLYKLLMSSFLQTLGKKQERQWNGNLYNYSLEASNDKCALLPQFNVRKGTKQREKELKDPFYLLRLKVWWEISLPPSYPHSCLFFLCPPSFSLSPSIPIWLFGDETCSHSTAWVANNQPQEPWFFTLRGNLR